MMKGLRLGEEYTVTLSINNTSDNEEKDSNDSEEETSFSFIACKYIKRSTIGRVLHCKPVSKLMSGYLKTALSNYN
jgi:hypothetical protein